MLAAMTAGAEQVSDEDALGTAVFMRELIGWCWVAPKIVSGTKEDNEIDPREIRDEDLGALLAWALRTKEAETLRPFRVRRNDNRGCPDGERVLMQTIGADGDRGPDYGFGL
jgi:hypothetical protein